MNYFCFKSIFVTILAIDCLQISEEENDMNSGHKSLVTTQFVDWSCKYFAQPVMKFLEDNDVESNLHYEREWRY
jgi:regulator-associated protein of mTOR